MASHRILLALSAFASLKQQVLADADPINTPTPILEPAYPGCHQFDLAGVGQDCTAIIAAAGLSRAEFFRINPAVGGEAGCQTQIFAHTWYCVRSAGATSTPDDDGEDRPQRKPEPPKGESPFWYPEPEPESEPTTTEEAPQITEGPPVPGFCNNGNCWYEFAQLSFGMAGIQQQASGLCTSLFNAECEDHNTLGFSANVAKGCKNCKELSSGCPCLTGGKYHTYTKNRVMYSRPGDGDLKYPGKRRQSQRYM